MCIAYLGKHADILRSVFAQAAGFNQTPPKADATWHDVRQNKLDMGVDQLLEYFTAVGLVPKFIKHVDLDNAVGCVTAGNQLLHGTRPRNLNYAQFVETLGSLATNCFAPERREEENKAHLWGTPLKRLEFMLSHMESI